MLDELLLATKFFDVAGFVVVIDRPEKRARYASSKEPFHIDVLHENIVLMGCRELASLGGLHEKWLAPLKAGTFEGSTFEGTRM